MFGLHPRKGTLAPGSDADIVVFNPSARRTLSAATHHMRVDYSCYEGRSVCGVPEVVLQRGNVLVRDGKFHGTQGAGRFLERSRFGPGQGGSQAEHAAASAG
jgi:dihydropyrimidinase